MVTHLYGILGVILDRTFGNIIRMLRVIRLPKEERGHLSWTFVGTLAVILAYGLIMMFSASYSSGYTNHGGNIYYFIKPQAIVAAVGFVVMLGVSLINYRALRYMFWTFYVITLALLVLALALWCTLGVSAEDTTTTASGTAGSFQLEQVYVNAPELDVYFYATDANGESYSPIVVQAQGVEATLGDRKLDTGMIGVAEDPICYIIALDNSTSIDAEDFHKMRTAIWKLAQTKQDKDQIMVYTLAGGAQCALPATNDKAEIFNTLRTIGQNEGAIDLTGTVTMLAADIQTEYQSLAPRKVAFVCTDAAQIMTNLALLGGTLGTDQRNLNMAMYTFICTAAPDQLESTTQMSGGKVIACRHADLAAEMQAKQTKFAQALTLRTEVPDSLTGERQEIFTLSVPKLGSAVKSSTTVYMGFKMEKPQVTKVEPLGRTKLRLTFNQAVNANADRPQYYRVYTNDVWGWYVKIESVQLSEDGRTAVLTTEPLYQGRYNVTLNKVASRMTPANVSKAAAL